MKPFAAEMMDAFRKKIQSALITVAHELNRQTDRWTPVWRGYLQRSKRVEVKGGDVYVVAGDSRTRDYALAQYYKPLRHRGDFQSGLQNLTALYRDAGGKTPKRGRTRVRRTGMGERYLYNRAYRLALESGQLTRLPAPMWYDRAAKDTQLMNELREIFVRRL